MTTRTAISGIHHVTAITADAQKNLDFYSGVLGLRLVKKTVNFDDSGSYHLYYGDELGRPGTILTFFAWQGAGPGRTGPPQVTATAFAAPAAALPYWTDRLEEQGVAPPTVITRFGEPVLVFTDGDGLRLEIVFSAQPGGQPWRSGPVPPEYALRGLHGVTMAEEDCEATGEFLEKEMGFRAEGVEQNRRRYRAGEGNDLATVVDLLCVGNASGPRLGAGVVHHLAFRTADDGQQASLREHFAGLGFKPSAVMDRNYFRSIYLREPGGVLFEFATDTPGFTADQPAEQLGARLMLPSWLEDQRTEIEDALPPLKLPT
jgi:glyoxalase family protein